MSRSRVLLVGWDAADWKVIRPLVQKGELPHLAGLMKQGVHGNLATIYPVLSPMLWTSIATGKRAYKHGIHGFTEPLPNGAGVRPVTTLSRKTKAVWNILNQTGHRSIVVGWWPSHPAEPINGVMVSNHFQHPVGKPGNMPPLPPGTVHPPGLAASLAELRVNPMELTGEFLRLFVPDYEKVDQSKDKRLHTLGKIIAETISIHAVATELIESERWDFAAVYYSSIDHFGHGFMRYHPPRLPWVGEADFDIYNQVIANAYRYHDAMLGRLLGLVDEETTVIVMSDHGFHPDHQRPGYIPAEPAGPAVEHRHFGMLCMKGGQVRSGQQLFGASILDVCPTILTLFGLQPAQDMDGKVLTTTFRESPEIKPIPSWDEVTGNAGTHPADTQLDPVASAEAFRQLVELGYVEPPGSNVKQNVAECVRESKYNLARAYLDGGRCREATTLVRELWERWPDEHRFGTLLADCLATLGEVTERREVIAELDRRIQHYQVEARAELKRRRESKALEPVSEECLNNPEKRREQYELRKLNEHSMERPLLMESLRLHQALLENKPTEARRHLKRIEESDTLGAGMRERMAGAMVQLGELDEAQRLLEGALEIDSENPQVHAQLAGIHFKAERFADAIAAATESLSLLYYNPATQALLGRALMAERRYEEAEKALLVAVAQSPHLLSAHETLGRLYREHLQQPDRAFAHEGRAASLRNEAANRESTRAVESIAPVLADHPVNDASTESDELFPPPFAPNVDPAQVITVVSGLPRSGTSLMMQLLVAAGKEALTDARREADDDNPLGYFEFEPATTLARDKTWLPQARGRVVKVVAQLLPLLPRNEHYHIVFMERQLAEVVASQRAMLLRLKRPGEDFDPQKLAETFRIQINRVRKHLRQRPEIRLLTMSYDDLLENPAARVEVLAQFLGGKFDGVKAVKAVRPELRHQKRHA